MSTNFEKLRSMSVDELAKWLDENGQCDTAPWMVWWDKTYCRNCPDIMCHYKNSDHEFPCAYCEIHDTCKFFPNFNYVPGHEDTVKMWLEAEVQDEE